MCYDSQVEVSLKGLSVQNSKTLTAAVTDGENEGKIPTTASQLVPFVYYFIILVLLPASKGGSVLETVLLKSVALTQTSFIFKN